MLRECARLPIAAIATVCTGCSVLLDFDQAPLGDAAVDGPFTQAECSYKEPNDSFATAVMVEASDQGPAAICPPMPGVDDRDFYKFTVNSATVTVSIMLTRQGGDLDIKLYDGFGTMQAQARGFGNTEMIVCPGPSPACPMLSVGSDYVLEVFPAIAGAANAYTFSILP
jgi:hypothetical protein